MNERIFELWNQSRYPSGRGHDEEKFAELIVRECAEFVRKQNYESIRNEEPYNVTSTDILEHFGVGE